MKIPLSPISGKGLSGWILIPVTTSVSPKRTRAEPLACGITPVSIVRGRCSSNALPSNLCPFSNKSLILFRFSLSKIEVVATIKQLHFQKICLLMPVFEFHRFVYNRRRQFLHIF